MSLDVFEPGGDTSNGEEYLKTSDESGVAKYIKLLLGSNLEPTNEDGELDTFPYSSEDLHLLSQLQCTGGFDLSATPPENTILESDRQSSTIDPAMLSSLQADIAPPLPLTPITSPSPEAVQHQDSTLKPMTRSTTGHLPKSTPSQYPSGSLQKSKSHKRPCKQLSNEGKTSQTSHDPPGEQASNDQPLDMEASVHISLFYLGGPSLPLSFSWWHRRTRILENP
ncbi:hypothetical protein C0995_001578 [Termitomyces sp. Mi166|nr:hypothetical protein C0995_001578 [Termitomyces sp. Mi166\